MSSNEFARVDLRHAIAKQIQRTSEDLLQVAASRELPDRGKRARFYRLTGQEGQ